MLNTAFFIYFMIDTNRDKGLRQIMIEELRKKGIDNELVLSAMLTMPRHYFVSSSFYERAYIDAALPINCGQTISQPFTVAKQTSLLDITPKQKILEIGTGSGYQAAILKTMGGYVYSIERHRVLYEQTKQLFANLSLNIACRLGDGYLGWTEFAPFDRILITCGAPEIPEKLLSQLKIGGILVAPIGEQEQIMTKVVRVSESEWETSLHGHCSFVPMLKNVNY